MVHALYHARSSARQFGGSESDYLPLHQFLDQTKAYVPGSLHRLVLHNTFGIQLCEEVYGVEWQRPSDGKLIATRLLVQQHINEDFGFVPTLSECFQDHPFYHEQQVHPYTPAEVQVALAHTLKGVPEDYRELVNWFYKPVELLENPQFFCLLGNSFGTFLAEARFGIALQRASDGKELPTQTVAEWLVRLSLGFLPTLTYFFRGMPLLSWMSRCISLDIEE
ncbi:hypothetical protein EI42_05003 [Thermosporothrix hazakensis]|jgi:hypothetical protein|uniref:DUF6915 domain-containing protein n=2 Tax=Thermosporothrix TaxID=768650 RepID=A0A326U178_THEHA|nr:hypothetical protein [Thermosporothrix hazakensis]PZW23381.1 hypothetical protein EI42_05003 [Thermosporothrix hazakensis]BBH89726.1 hypothetical protein KTC_44770 [Thermosporothrix sp. COM3]GCE47915.1 hypothetical protein KTH_27840 [Thermosporothrix hazakensis]